MPLPPLSPSEAPQPFGGCFPAVAHFKARVSHWCTRRLPRFISGGVACSASQLYFASAPAAAALHSSQTWSVSCLIAQNRLWGSLPEVGTLAGPWQLLLPSETARNQRLISGLNLGSSSLQTPCLQGGGSAVWGSPRDSHFSESLTRTRS